MPFAFELQEWEHFLYMAHALARTSVAVIQLNHAHTVRVLGHDICSGTSVENFNKTIRQSIAKDATEWIYIADNSLGV
jgi:hypothetical protein